MLSLSAASSEVMPGRKSKKKNKHKQQTVSLDVFLSTRPSPSAPQSHSPSSLPLVIIDHKHQDRDVELLNADLTQDNYKEKFHQLLCREEEEHKKILHER